MSNFLVKQSHKCIWHFTHSKANGICFSKMKDEYVSEYEQLLKEGKQDFDVIIDDENHIHLVCQDEQGNVFYLLHENENWRKSIVLQSKNNANYDKKFSIIKYNNNIFLFYVIEHNGKKMLTYQELNSTPIAIDYIYDSYRVCIDDGKIHIVYCADDSQKIVCKTYDSSLSWSKYADYDFEGIPIGDSLTINNKLIIAAKKDKSIIVFDGSTHKKIGEGSGPILFVKQNTLWCLWISDQKIQAKKSNDMGETWQNGGNILSGRTVLPILYKLRYTNAEQHMNADKCYGYNNNNILHLYLLNKFFFINRVPPSNKKPVQVTDKLNEIEVSRIKNQTTDIFVQLNTIAAKIDRIDQGIDAILAFLEKRKE